MIRFFARHHRRPRQRPTRAVPLTRSSEESRPLGVGEAGEAAEEEREAEVRSGRGVGGPSASLRLLPFLLERVA